MYDGVMRPTDENKITISKLPSMAGEYLPEEVHVGSLVLNTWTEIWSLRGD